VNNWNAFIHLAGTDAELAWTDVAAQQPVRFFITVDLDVVCFEDMSPLIAALEPHAYALERPPGITSFELNQPESWGTPEPHILEFVRAVNALPPPVRALWDRAQTRVFDIGILNGGRPVQEAHSLSPETLRAAADVGAAIALTIYPLPPEDYVCRPAQSDAVG